MSEHRHPIYVDGCYRCELSRDEAREAARESIDDVLDELGRLVLWKREATTVLNLWDDAYERAQIEGHLGQVKSAVMLAEIERLRRERDAALKSVVWFSDWTTRATNAMGELLDELDPDTTDPVWSDIRDLLAEEYDDGEDG